MNDRVFWCLTTSGEFSMKFSYNAIRGLHSLSDPHMLSKDWKDLWKLKVNARLKNLLWKMCCNIQPTCSALNNRFPISSLNCFLCNNALETIEHLFLQCDWAIQLWLLALWPLYMSKLSSLSILDWIKVILNPKSMLGLGCSPFWSFLFLGTFLWVFTTLLPWVFPLKCFSPLGLPLSVFLSSPIFSSSSQSLFSAMVTFLL